MHLKTVPGRFGVAQLGADSAIPQWFPGLGFKAVINADDEMTIVCSEDRIPEGVTSELGWSCFRTVGPFAFDQVGVVAALVSPLSKAGIGVFVVCTFDGEHILCPANSFSAARNILVSEGHEFSL